MERINNWLSSAVGRAMNPDGMYGLQCKDVADDYCIHLFGNWQNTIRPGDALVCYKNANPDYFTKVPYPSIPPRGALVVWGAMRGNQYGHIAVVESADANGMTIIEQNGGSNKPAQRIRRGYNLLGVNPIGFLIPKPEKILNKGTEGDSTVETIKSMYWRLLGREADAGGIKHYTTQVVQKGWEFVYNDLKNSSEGQADWQRRSPSRVASLEQEIARLTAEVNKLKTNPVVKTVEKIVEKKVEVPVEKIVYQTVKKPCEEPDEKAVVEGWFKKLWNKLFK